MRDIIAEKRTFRVRKGDMLLLLSDGVLQVGDSSGALRAEANRLPMASAGNAHAVASAVLTAARTQSSCADDLSVCAVRLY